MPIGIKQPDPTIRVTVNRGQEWVDRSIAIWINGVVTDLTREQADTLQWKLQGVLRDGIEPMERPEDEVKERNRG